MIRLDPCCKLIKPEMIQHPGRLRPRFFMKVGVYCEKSKMSFERAVLVLPFLFRIRVKMNYRKMARAARKYRKFAERNALLPKV